MYRFADSLPVVRFSADGILFEYPHTPLDRRDPTALLSRLGATVALDADVTVKDVFTALAPWFPLLTELTHVDIAGLHAELHAPHAAMPDITAVHLQAEAELTAVHGPAAPPSLRFGWAVHGLYDRPRLDPDKGLQETVPLDHTHLAGWSHLPLVLAPDMRLIDRTRGTRPVFNPDHPATSHVDSAPQFALQPLRPTLQDTLLAGLIVPFARAAADVGTDSPRWAA